MQTPSTLHLVDETIESAVDQRRREIILLENFDLGNSANCQRESEQRLSPVNDRTSTSRSDETRSTVFSELCDGLQLNSRLNQLDLRLQGNPLESFLRENAARLASIPSLIALDLTACGQSSSLLQLDRRRFSSQMPITSYRRCSTN